MRRDRERQGGASWRRRWCILKSHYECVPELKPNDLEQARAEEALELSCVGSQPERHTVRPYLKDQQTNKN